MSSRNLNENGSGVHDPVAGDVIGRLDAERKKAKKRAKKFNKITRTLHDICDLSGFRFKGRVIIVDKVTGEEFYFN